MNKGELLLSHNANIRKPRRSGVNEYVIIIFSSPGGELPRGGDSYMKQTGVLVVSLRGVNFRFWSRLGCSGQSANILSRQGLV